MDTCLVQVGRPANFASMRADAVRVANWHRGITMTIATHVGTEFKPYAQRPKESLP